MGFGRVGGFLGRTVFGLLAISVGGCLAVVPTVPLRLPAHDHTYRVTDEANRPVADGGILVVTTFYWSGDDRVDCYPIRDGKAVLPYVTDVRSVRLPALGMLSLLSEALWFDVLINADHAHVYPVVPGRAYRIDFFSPLINRSNFIYGVKARPDVLRVLPMTPAAELDLLRELEGEAELYIRTAELAVENRQLSVPEDRHNAEQARVILDYVHSRRAVLLAAGGEDAETPDPPPAPLQPADRAIDGAWLSSREKAFRALEAVDHATLRRELEWGLDPNSYDRAPWTLLNRAIVLGDLPAVRMLVERGADVNRTVPRLADSWSSHGHKIPVPQQGSHVSAEGYSPAVVAAASGQLEILQFLLAKGAKTIAPGEGYTLLHAAADTICDAQQGDGPGRRAVAAWLLEQGLDVNAVYAAPCPCNDGAPLDVARARHRPKLARFLQSRGGRPAPKPASRETTASTAEQPSSTTQENP